MQRVGIKIKRLGKTAIPFFFLASFALLALISACDLRSNDSDAFELRYDYFDDQSLTNTHVLLSHHKDISTFPVVLFMHGAGCGSTEHIHPSSRRYLKDAQVGILTIDKPGSYHGFKQILSLVRCSQEFKLNNYPSRRAEVAIRTLERLKNEVSGWNGELYIISAHEGALAAAIIASKIKVDGLVILGTGDGFSDSSSFEEVSKCLSKKDSNCNNFSNSKELIEAALAKSNSDKINYRGIRGSGMWWNEMLKLKTSEILKEYRSPILISHSEFDSTIPSKSAHNLADKLKSHGNKSVELKIHKGIDGGFMDKDNQSRKHEVQLSISAWIKKIAENTKSIN